MTLLNDVEEAAWTVVGMAIALFVLLVFGWAIWAVASTIWRVIAW